jgi:cell pole-organizing protein PopZ
MSDAAGQEPSMEEILASIRKVISEDDEEGTEAEEEIAKAEPKPVFEEDDTLELTEEFEPDLAEEISLVDEVLNDEGLVSAVTTEAGASAFAQLAGASDSNLMLGRADRTLESLVREVMRPLLSSWLEANLPNVVERLVQAEIQKMSDKIER